MASTVSVGMSGNEWIIPCNNKVEEGTLTTCGLPVGRLLRKVQVLKLCLARLPS